MTQSINSAMCTGIYHIARPCVQQASKQTCIIKQTIFSYKKWYRLPQSSLSLTHSRTCKLWSTTEQMPALVQVPISTVEQRGYRIYSKSHRSNLFLLWSWTKLSGAKRNEKKFFGQKKFQSKLKRRQRNRPNLLRVKPCTSEALSGAQHLKRFKLDRIFR
jgi:hypothetical protein